jgi:hypothetical protein
VAPPAHGTSHESKHHQDQADNHENNPDAPQNGNLAMNPITSRMMPRMIIYFSWPSFDGMMS